MVQITTLNNGLTVISDQMNETETVSISVWFNVGARNEEESENGISHFLEHMAFKGTDTRSAKQIAEEFDNIGGYFNAHTSREHTVYYAKVLKDDFAKAATILCDILQNSIFEEEELSKERGVVLQEIAMTNDTPDDVIFDHYQEAAFAGQPMGRPILGREEIVSAISRTDLRKYVDTHYINDRCVIGVAGKIDHKQVVDFFENNFDLPTRGEKAEPAMPATYTGGNFMVERDLEQVHFLMGFEGVSYLDPKIYTVQILASILGGSMSSRLFQEVRENRGLAYSVSSFNSSYRDSGIFTIYSGTDPKRVTELVDVVCAELKKASQLITETELVRARAQAKSSLLMAIESSSSRADDMARQYICLNKIYSHQEILEKINSVTTSDVAGLMGDFLQKDKITVAAIGDLSNIPDIVTIQDKLKA